MPSHSNPDLPTTAEIADLTARLRELSSAGAAADAAERARFLADKDALIARITAAAQPRRPATTRSGRSLGRERRRGRAHRGRACPGCRRWLRPGRAQRPNLAHRSQHRAPRRAGRRGRAQGPAPAHGTRGVHHHRARMARRRDRQHRHPRRRRRHRPRRRARPDRRRRTTDRRRTRPDRRGSRARASRRRPQLDEARALVRGYLDDVSEQIGASAHLWGLDGADLDAIRAGERARDHSSRRARPRDQLTAGTPTTTEDAAADDDETADEP